MAEHLDIDAFQWHMHQRDVAVIACDAGETKLLVGEGDVFGYPSQDWRDPCEFAEELMHFLVDKAMGITRDNKK